MGLRGPAPKPTALKILEGNPGKRPLLPDIFTPERESPPCPDHITGRAREHWDYVTEQLNRYGMLAKTDMGQLAALCTTWARYVEAEEMIALAAQQAPMSKGWLQKKDHGMSVAPWLRVSRDAIDQYTRLAAKFGLSPTDRMRMPHSAAPAIEASDDRGAAKPAGWALFKQR